MSTERAPLVGTVDDAVDLIATLCGLTELAEGPPEALGTASTTNTGAAIARHDTPVLYRLLMDGFSFQGISDANARAFIARHGNADWATLQGALAQTDGLCPKLHDFVSYRGCGYRKTLRSCGNPEALPSCPVPTLPLRKGVLNEQAFSAFFFIRDRCGGDLVGILDEVIASAANAPDALTAQRERLLTAFGEICGVSRKLVSMMLATLLMAADATRPDWVRVGGSMIAVDSLVHNFLHRTGVLAAYGGEHLYGLRCFGEGGCEETLRDLADKLRSRPATTGCGEALPRTVQHAVWRFCAADELSICNGNNIKDELACDLSWCPLWAKCSRLPLRPTPRREEAP